jgi:hypothetical protein
MHAPRPVVGSVVSSHPVSGNGLSLSCTSPSKSQSFLVLVDLTWKRVYGDGTSYQECSGCSQCGDILLPHGGAVGAVFCILGPASFLVLPTSCTVFTVCGCAPLKKLPNELFLLFAAERDSVANSIKLAASSNRPSRPLLASSA